MSIRYGTSWPGRRPGTRHWVPAPLMPFGILGLTLFPFILGAWAAFWLLAAELWLRAEFWIAAVSGAVALCQLAERQGRPRDVTIRRLARLSLPSLPPSDQERRLCLVSTLWA